MWTRIMDSGPSRPRDFVPQVSVCLLLSLLLVRTPSAYQNPDRVRPYVDGEVKQALLLVFAVLCVAVMISQLVRAATMLGILAPVYGRVWRESGALASAWGVLGNPRDRLVVKPGVVRVRLEDSGPMRPFYPRGLKHIYLEQDGRVLHVASSVGFTQTSRIRLAEWLGTRGASVEWRGSAAVLDS